MALRVVTMTELRLEVLLEPQRTGETVAEVCRRREISRQSYYRFKRRYEAEGPEGLEARSRRPCGSPWQIHADLEVEICRMRKDHPRWGARRIRAELRRSGVDPPAVSTIHRVLRRNHLVADQPRSAPRPSRSGWPMRDHPAIWPTSRELLDRFRAHYNEERPHQGIGDLTPAERYGRAPPRLQPPRISRSPTTRGEPSFAPCGGTGCSPT